MLGGTHLALSLANARTNGISEADWNAAQTARQLAKEQAATIRDSKQEVEDLKKELEDYESQLKELEKETVKPGALEKALEAFLQRINVNTPLSLSGC